MRKALLVAVVCAHLVVAPQVGADTTPSVAISEVYAGGGGIGASFRNDFVEIFNRSRWTIDLAGWKIAYSPPDTASWITATLRGTLPASRFYLIGFGGSGGTGARLPRPDVWGTSNLARASGEVALFDRSMRRVDLVGYGPGADAYEGRPAPAATTNAQSVTRVPSPCIDTDRNDVDFRIKSPTPRSRTSYGYACPA